MLKQRTTRNLGLNRSRDKEKIYRFIEANFGKTKYCSRGSSKLKSKYDLVHVGSNPLPIREFNLQAAFVDSRGRVIIRGSGLQPYCIACERKYRRGRLNKWLEIYSKMTDLEVRNSYIKNYGPTARCSRCSKSKSPEEFGISRRMDRGLHNVCLECSKLYHESVGNRWIIFSPDGRNDVSLKSAKCVLCNSKKRLHKDHIWPLSKGGTDYPENIQILCGTHNLSKSDTILGINSIKQVKQKMISKRYWLILNRAKAHNWAIPKFELAVTKKVREFLIWKKNLNDKDLSEFFKNEKARSNRKHSIERAVRKFREYAKTAILEISEYISKNS